MQEEKLLETIRALLAKAESTTFEAEAESYFAKAHELMLKHAIDEAMVRAAGQDKVEPADIILHSIRVPGKSVQAKAKRELLVYIAQANRCRPFVTGANGRGEEMLVAGYRSDAQFVEMLYTSVLVQMVTSTERGLREARAEGLTTNASVFRNNFAHAYAYRINKRLQEQNSSTQHGLEHQQVQALTLYKGSVDQWIEDNMKTRKAKASRGRDRQFSPEAQRRGDAAAMSADLSGGRGQVNQTTSRQLS